MLINQVVVNASPLICLFKSGLAELFPALFKDVAVPEAVIKEVMAKGTVDFAAQTLISNSWIRRIGNVAIDPRVASWDLGEGENAVLSFALKIPDYFAKELSGSHLHMSEIIGQGSSIKKLDPINSDCGMGIAKYSRI